ncbi:DUF1543 domain-containing protein [Pontibacter sp. JH31]|uniref:DUF1543 domain-containing protein n=1 Tax=Pontibacter aquaedesilientis TaxID=2766980 RepID=A0ABR7XBR0_9BACT|nr:DUF1543 domain-containing protein [Pontibacter aquaedesilientis]MBD1395730.1 DUF1543 domain-containing protein [Pontibacter aquaedesilientis]
MQNPKLFMLMLGCRPEGRNTEQHDMLFAIGEQVSDLVPAIKAFWPEAKGNIHVDAWREVRQVNGHQIQVVPKEDLPAKPGAGKLFFLNLGGYKPGEFDEFHYKMLAVAENQAGAIQQAKQTAFYKHTGFKGAASHIDDKFGVDVDEVYEVKDILTAGDKARYSLQVLTGDGPEDEMHLGYFQLHKL